MLCLQFLGFLIDDQQCTYPINFPIFASMVLLPIDATGQNRMEGYPHADCLEVLEMFPQHYAARGFEPPWIGYLVLLDNQVVGSGGFKGGPRNGKVEIAYWTFKEFQHQGIGTLICRELVNLSLNADPGLIISARTCSLENASARILAKNGFQYSKVVEDDAGDIYEWEFNYA